MCAMQAYGPTLRRIREGQGVSLRAVARLLEVSPTFVSDVERGYRNPFEDDVNVRVARFLDVDPHPILAAAAETRIRHALTQNFPNLSDDAIGRMVKLAIKDVEMGAR